MTRRSRILVIIAAAVTVWYVLVLTLWALQPLPDSIPVGLGANGRAVSQEVECNSLFSSEAASEPLPVLIEPLVYGREACVIVRRDARLVFAIDTLVALVALAGVVWVALRSRTDDDDESGLAGVQVAGASR